MNILSRLILMLGFIVLSSICNGQDTDVISRAQHSFQSRNFKNLREKVDTLAALYEVTSDSHKARQIAKLISYGYHESAEHLEAIEWYKKVIPLAIEQDDQEDLFYTHLNIGKCYTHKDSLEQGLFYFKKCGDYYNELDLYQKFHLNYSLAFLFFRKENLSKAIYYDQNTLAVAEEINDTLLIMDVMYDLACIYDRSEISDSTFYYLDQAQELLNSYPHDMHQWKNLACRGITEIKTGEYAAGIRHLEESMILGKSIGQELCCGNSAHLGVGYAFKGDFDEAKKYLKQAEGEVFQLPKIDDRKVVLQSLYNGYRLLDDTPLALKYHELLQSTRDSINSRKYDKQVAAYEVELGLNELNRRLEKSNAALDTVSTKSRYYKYGLGILSGAVFLLLILYAIKKKELARIRKAYNAELDLKIEPTRSVPLSIINLNIPRDSFTQRLEQVILNSLDHPQLSVNFLSDKLNMSPRNLSRLCKKHTGMTPGQYIIFMRIEKSKLLLKSEDLSVKEIAFECGYLDPAYFSRVFKNEVGTTPNSWRKQIQA